PALRQVRQHGLVCSLKLVERPPVRLVRDLERRPCTVTSIRTARQRYGLAVAAFAHDALKPDIEVFPYHRALFENRLQRPIGQLVGLLLGVGDHRDIRVGHRPTNRLAVAPAVTPHRRVRMQLGRRNPRRELRLRCPLRKRNPRPLKPPPASLRMILRVDLVEPPDQIALVVVESRRLTAQIPRPEAQVLLNPRTNLRPQARPYVIPIIGDYQQLHETALITALGSETRSG